MSRAPARSFLRHWARQPVIKGTLDIMSGRRIGNCYEVAGDFMIEKSLQGTAELYKLVHGIVTGQGPIADVQHGHAWIEYSEARLDLVFDPSTGTTLPREFFYKIGQIEVVIRYDWKEAKLLMSEHRHYGPWNAVIWNSRHVKNGRRQGR
jgi:hypothetical protein